MQENKLKIWESSTACCEPIIPQNIINKNNKITHGTIKF